jgi:predicted acetyltransferase
LLRALMARQLDDIQERGEPVAILYATEGSIYGRFGYGVATDTVGYGVELRRAAFTSPVDYDGTVDFVGPDEAESVMPDVYDAFRVTQPGAIDRPSFWWHGYFHSGEAHSEGKRARFFLAARSSSGAPEGYAAYWIDRDWQSGRRHHTARIDELIATNARAYAALWRMLLSLDLIDTAETRNSSLQEPLRWLLADPRELRVWFRHDGTWLRIVDVPAALAARRYGTEDTLVLEVHDRFHPASAGRFRIDGSPDGASCKRTGEAPDLVMQIEDLGAAYLGGTPFSSLARALRVIEETPTALRRADVMFLSSPHPWGTTQF